MKLKLTSIPLFSTLSDRHLELLAAQLNDIQLPKDRIIITEGEKSDSLYIVNKGFVKIFISDREGKEVQLRVLGAGDYFGELSLIDQKPRSASVACIGKCDLSVISSRDFLQLLSENPEMYPFMLKVQTERLRGATELQKQLGLMDVYGRLRASLVASAIKSDGMMRIDPKPRQQDLANTIGASREMVSRLLSDLKSQGYIEIHKYSILIKKQLPEKL